MTDPLAPFDSGNDPLAPAPVAPPPRPMTPDGDEPSRVPDNQPGRPREPEPPGTDVRPEATPATAQGPTAEPHAVGMASGPVAESDAPGKSRPGSAGAAPGPSKRATGYGAVDAPPKPRRSLLWRVVSFSWELTVIGAIVVLGAISAGVVYVVNWADSLGPTYTAAEFYDEEHIDATVTNGGEVEIETSLDKVGAWDHEDCAGIADDEKIQSGIETAGCEYGIEGVYERADLDYTIYQRILEFPDGEAARRGTAALGDLEELAPKLRFSVDMAADARHGSRADVEGGFLIFTVAVVTTDDDKSVEEAEEGLHVMHVEHRNVLLLDNM